MGAWLRLNRRIYTLATDNVQRPYTWALGGWVGFVELPPQRRILQKTSKVNWLYILSEVNPSLPWGSSQCLRSKRFVWVVFALSGAMDYK
jgi:hypothetical protein